MIIINNFSKKYFKGPYAVENINLKAERGITSILGLNGAGKSTIIKAILGLHYPTSGTILVSDSKGNTYDSCVSPSSVRLITGYVGETSNLNQSMYVNEYLYGIHKLYGTEDFSSVIKLCCLEEVMHKKIKTLSKGFLQRVSIAECLLHGVDNIVLDEGISGLDPYQIHQMRNLIKKLGETKTVLLSSHIMQEVHNLCDKIYIIHKGRVVMEGDENSIIQQTSTSNIEEAFLKATECI